MNFSSLIFIALFLPLFLLSTAAAPGARSRNVVLLLFSLVFYAFSGIGSLLLLLFMSVTAWFCGRVIVYTQNQGQSFAEMDLEMVPSEERKARRARLRRENQEPGSRTILPLVLAVSLFLASLLIFKYTGFLADTVRKLSGLDIPVPHLLLPLGISFYTFRLISYVTDVYSGRTEAASLFEVLLYAFDFHLISEGPIVRFKEISKDLRTRQQDIRGFSGGMFRFTIGLSKKMLLANHAGELADMILPTDFAALSAASVSTEAVLLGSLFYMLQIYLDFSAYSDMAVGLGQVCGIRYPENFNYPYVASSVRDFWRRWHISLSAFFRDYVYIPMGGSRVGMGRLVLNLFVVWFLTGFWHGASWNFIFWGLYYFAFVLLEDLVGKFWKRREDAVLPAFVRAVLHVYTLAVVYIGWILFRISDLNSLRLVFRVMAGRAGTALTDQITSLTLLNNLFFLFVAVLACTPLLHLLGEHERAVVKQGWMLKEREEKRAEERAEDAEREKELLSGISLQFDTEREREAARDAVLSRIRARISRQIQRAGRVETRYYLVRSVISLVLLFLSLAAMVGSSYQPFLYNQF